MGVSTVSTYYRRLKRERLNLCSDLCVPYYSVSNPDLRTWTRFKHSMIRTLRMSGTDLTVTDRIRRYAESTQGLSPTFASRSVGCGRGSRPIFYRRCETWTSSNSLGLFRGVPPARSEEGPGNRCELGRV